MLTEVWTGTRAIADHVGVAGDVMVVEGHVRRPAGPIHEEPQEPLVLTLGQGHEVVRWTERPDRRQRYGAWSGFRAEVPLERWPRGLVRPRLEVVGLTLAPPARRGLRHRLLLDPLRRRPARPARGRRARRPGLRGAGRPQAYDLRDIGLGPVVEDVDAAVLEVVRYLEAGGVREPERDAAVHSFFAFAGERGNAARAVAAIEAMD